MNITYRVKADVYYGRVVYHVERLWFGFLWLRTGCDFNCGFATREQANTAAMELATVNGGEVL